MYMVSVCVCFCLCVCVSNMAATVVDMSSAALFHLNLRPPPRQHLFLCVFSCVLCFPTVLYCIYVPRQLVLPTGSPAQFSPSPSLGDLLFNVPRISCCFLPQ